MIAPQRPPRRGAAEILVDEAANKTVEVHLRLPSELRPRLARVTDEIVQLRPTSHELRITSYMVPPVESDVIERNVYEIADAMRYARRDYVVVGLLLLQHEPHRLDVVAGEALIASCIKIAEQQFSTEVRA